METGQVLALVVGPVVFPVGPKVQMPQVQMPQVQMAQIRQEKKVLSSARATNARIVSILVIIMVISMGRIDS